MYCLPREDLVVVIFTARKRSLGQGNIFTQFVILFTGGVSASVHAGIPPLPGSRPPPEQTPLEQTPPAQSMLGDMVNARTVRILLECNLVAVISWKCLPDFRRPVVLVRGVT